MIILAFVISCLHFVKTPRPKQSVCSATGSSAGAQNARYVDGQLSLSANQGADRKVLIWPRRIHH